MANWQSKLTDSTVRDINDLEHMLNHRRGLTGGGDDVSASGASPQLSMSIIGMNAAKSDELIERINTYINDVEKELARYNDMKLKIRNSIASVEIEQAMANYINRVIEYTNNVTGYFKYFTAKVKEAKAIWEAGARNTASNIDADAGSFNTGSGWTSL